MIRATRLVVGDRRIPRPLRWFGGLALLPVPGPFDESVLLLVAVPLFAFYRRPLRDAWLRAGAEGRAGEGAASSRAASEREAGPTTAEVDDGSR
ncbi:MAG: hypothetical protein JWN81_188 [Solirubrobacterales bacterium]|nr:hypothetical protein [Solirubrobacterales bacterium]